MKTPINAYIASTSKKGVVVYCQYGKAVLSIPAYLWGAATMPTIKQVQTLINS